MISSEDVTVAGRVLAGFGIVLLVFALIVPLPHAVESWLNDRTALSGVGFAGLAAVLGGAVIVTIGG